MSLTTNIRKIPSPLLHAVAYEAYDWMRSSRKTKLSPDKSYYPAPSANIDDELQDISPHIAG
ncbi:hypothetical protein AGABI1DRAFT_134729 [Agaricus bisporus var. burnettii JB137-S8]|uniref:Uncharacterized protein n=1 Tax=Agaricus bisporus var. burnettii (strain JB137-S8 / ATCC MYA-4627 / FGSC 10392) TaxID=597362 RepID=K5WSD6_AGABU|nr:uncharacterized protein AGABI1DRAFT_134729 [Agaricus bisporus var. burnettii JB137-S8]EKM73462.1 hypothetical protein AGABI1DRAFT_134729 [Agaricus bisporus var. burnettii JB137-S8]